MIVKIQIRLYFKCRLLYTDEDRTKHYFYYDTTTKTYKDENGLNITLTVNSDNTYTIKDKGDNQLIFTASGYLWKIVDSNGNTLTLSYKGTVLSQITDGAGRIIKLNTAPDGSLLEITDPAGRKTSFAYNGTNLKTITYPDGKQTIYNYDSNNNLISAVNFDGYKVTYTYNNGVAQGVISALESHTDGTLGEEIKIAYGNNLTTFTDAKGRKDTYIFNDSGNTVSTRDSLGNANYTKYNENTNDPNKNKATLDSKLQKTTVNYLRNHNMEYDTDWTFVNDGSSTATGGFTTAEKYLGQRSITVNKTNSLNRSFNQQSLTLEKGKTYTLSGYIKTNGISNANSQGAHLLVNYKNNVGTWLETYSSYASGTNNWTRHEVTFTIPSNASTADIIIKTAITNETGTAYFDCLQLEDNSVANRYNLVENPDFRNGSFTWWNKSGDSDISDKVVYIDTKTDPNYVSANIDRNCFKINGLANKLKNINQTINVSGNTGDTYVVSGWAKADSVPLSSERCFSIDVGIQGLDGTHQRITVNFNQDSSDWQYASSVIKTDRPYKSITIYGLYYNNANTVYFDGFRLYKEEFGDSYTYDSNGNLISSSDMAKQNTSFAYNTKNDLISSTDPKGNKFQYEYDSKHDTTKATSAENVVNSFTYDSYGNPLTAKIGDNTLFTISTKTYTASGNYESTSTDSLGNTVKNTWNETKGLLTSTTDAKNTTITNIYDSNTDSLLSTSKTVEGQQITNSYTYNNDRISTISHNGFNYNFGYDSLGNNTTVAAGTQNLITNTYDTRTGKLLQITCGNGQQISNDYDNLDRVITQKYNGTVGYIYEYDASGNIGYQRDLVNNVNYRYIYDIANRLVQVKDSRENSVKYSYDLNNNISKISDKIGNSSYETSYGYDKDDKPTSITYNRNTANTITQTYDSLARLTGKTVNTGTVTYNTTYGFLAGVNGSTTNKVGTITNNGATITYTYDANGNIETITQNGKITKYTYNELNEVIREDNQTLNQTITYAYDAGGNITSKTEYPYTTETVGTATKTYPYLYGDTNWKDKLTSYDGKPITYDAIGNPLTYNGYTYTWKGGRYLAGISGNGNTITYKYNDNGIRTSKKVNGATTDYHLVGNLVTYETNGTDSIYYTYDSDDDLVSMNLNGVEYYYIWNAQNDIIGLFDKTGTQVVNYTYDIWGKVISITGRLANTVGVKNAYRYRGYRYNEEMELYYLQSRYYNSEFCRMLNADDTGILDNTLEDLTDRNLFAYCDNNPVMRKDNNGDSWGFALAGGGTLGSAWLFRWYEFLESSWMDCYWNCRGCNRWS